MNDSNMFEPHQEFIVSATEDQWRDYLYALVKGDMSQGPWIVSQDDEKNSSSAQSEISTKFIVI